MTTLVRRELRAFAPLFALNGFAVAQPVLDVLGRAPELVAFRGAGDLDLWLLGAGFVLAVPVGLWLLELLVGLVAGAARRPVHLAFVGVLAAGLGAQLGSRVIGLDGVVLALVAVLFGAAVAAATTRPLIGLWLSYAAWTPLAFLVLFAAFSPAASAAGDDGATVQGVTVTKPARVVMLVLDELPLASLLDADGTIDDDLYPGFAELAAASHWFRNATSVSSATTHAVPAILTGQRPDPTSRPLVSDHPDNLFTLLGGAYGMEVAESVTRLCPAALCKSSGGLAVSSVRALVGDGTRVWREQVKLDPASDPLASFREPSGPAADDDASDVGLAQPERFSSLLRSLKGTPTQTLHLAHVVLPHTPSRYLPSGHQYPLPAARLGPFWEEPGRFFDLWTKDGWPVQVGRQRAILQTQYVDRLVQELITTMRDEGVWDDSLVVVVADHGRAFEPGLSARGIDAGVDLTPVLPELMGVPLFVKVPGQQQPSVHDENVQTIDVLPTIADVLGVKVPWKVDGTSAFAPGPRPATKAFHEQVASSSRDGATFTVPSNGFFAKVLARSVSHFLGPPGPLRVERVGPGADLIGRTVTGSMLASPSPAPAELHDPDAFDQVDPASGSVPVFVSGEVQGGGDADVAVVLNGRIAGVSTRFDWDGHTGVFEVMLPEELLVPGKNRLELYLLDDPAQPRLHPLTLDGG